MENFNKEQLQKARRSDLYHFLRQYHSSSFRVEGNSIHPLFNDSISIRRGYSGYKDFATDETGNAVDFLTRYMNYSLVEAVLALCGEASANSVSEINMIQTYETEFPKASKDRWKQLYAYLGSRGIDTPIIQALIDSKLLYQSAERNNAVFINSDQDYAELRGTYTLAAKPFHGTIRKKPDGFWSFRVKKGDVKKAYVCEAAIDAISLFIFQKHQGLIDEPTAYCSIGGAANQSTIDRIKEIYPEVILAVDADKAGDICAEHNKDLERIVPPIGKDWNDTIKEMRSK